MSSDWVSDFDRHEIDLGEFRPGPYGKAIARGRCVECWGRLIGRRRDGDENWAQVRCRVCGVILEAAEANLEVDRMERESTLNLLNMRWGHAPKYRADAVFVRKLFPQVPRQDGSKVNARIRRKMRKGRKEGLLTRSGFPPGAPGHLFLQASILMAGLERFPLEMSVSGLDGIHLKDDGTALVPSSIEEIREDPQYPEYSLKQRMGSTMTATMMGAFACELAMKAISLTVGDEAKKEHDLLALFDDLPEPSRKRVEGDFADIRCVMAKSRYLFDKWRYFDSSVGGKSFNAMIDTKRSFRLGKAARVLLDEAQTVGLYYRMTLDTEARVRRRGERTGYNFSENLRLRVGESPPEGDPN